MCIRVSKLFVVWFLSLSIIIPQLANAKSKITIVRGQDFPPYHFVDRSGFETGFLIEIIQSVANKIDIEVKFEQQSWSRCLLMVKLGKADAMMNLFKTDERIEFMHFSNNILAYETNQFFKRNKSSFKYDGDLLMLSSYKIGAIFNYSYGVEFDSAQLNNIVRLETEEDLIKSLVNNRSDVIIGNAIVIKMLLRKMDLEKVVESILPIVSKAPLYIGFSKAKGHRKLSDNFSKALNQFKNSESHKLILKNYDQ